MPFKSYEEDVRIRHKNEFEVCLLYLRDFEGAIDPSDFAAIEALREYCNDLTHNLPAALPILNIERQRELLDSAHRTIFKLSNNQA